MTGEEIYEAVQELLIAIKEAIGQDPVEAGYCVYLSDENKNKLLASWPDFVFPPESAKLFFGLAFVAVPGLDNTQITLTRPSNLIWPRGSFGNVELLFEESV